MVVDNHHFQWETNHRNGNSSEIFKCLAGLQADSGVWTNVLAQTFQLDMLHLGWNTSDSCAWTFTFTAVNFISWLDRTSQGCNTNLGATKCPAKKNNSSQDVTSVLHVYIYIYIHIITHISHESTIYGHLMIFAKCFPRLMVARRSLWGSCLFLYGDNTAVGNPKKYYGDLLKAILYPRCLVFHCLILFVILRFVEWFGWNMFVHPPEIRSWTKMLDVWRPPSLSKSKM